MKRTLSAVCTNEARNELIGGTGEYVRGRFDLGDEASGSQDDVGLTQTR